MHFWKLKETSTESYTMYHPFMHRTILPVCSRSQGVLDFYWETFCPLTLFSYVTFKHMFREWIWINFNDNKNRLMNSHIKAMSHLWHSSSLEKWLTALLDHFKVLCEKKRTLSNIYWTHEILIFGASWVRSSMKPLETKRFFKMRLVWLRSQLRIHCSLSQC